LFTLSGDQLVAESNGVGTEAG